jgi:redox-sensing transcriptional repressor
MKKISPLVIPRLSLYYRALLESRKNGFISSEDLSKMTGLTSAQIRKDLGLFGQFGIPGRGYSIENLKTRILKILGTDKKYNVALVGVGNLGRALLKYKGFRRQGFNITCAFDNDCKKINKKIDGTKIEDIKNLKNSIKKKKVKIAIICVPKESAQKICNLLIDSGIRAILNFAPVRLKVSKRIECLNIDLSIELERLAYFLTREAS